MCCWAFICVIRVLRILGLFPGFGVGEQVVPIEEGESLCPINREIAAEGSFSHTFTDPVQLRPMRRLAKISVWRHIIKGVGTLMKQRVDRLLKRDRASRMGPTRHSPQKGDHLSARECCVRFEPTSFGSRGDSRFGHPVDGVGVPEPFEIGEV